MSEENEIVSPATQEVSVETVNSEATETDNQISEEAQAQEQPQEKQDPWYKKRIDELTRDKHEARRQAERLEKVLAQQEEMLRQLQPKATEAPSALTPPNPADFAGGQYDPRYMEAMMQYTRASAIEEAKQAVAAEYEARNQQQRIAEQQAKLETAEAAARARYPDYDSTIEAITSDPRLANNPTIRQALLGMDNGPDIAYQLGRNIDVAYEIASMNPIQAGIRLAQLIRPEPTGRAAPKPINPIAGTGGVTGKPDPSNMSTSDYIKYMNNLEREERMARRTR